MWEKVFFPTFLVLRVCTCIKVRVFFFFFWCKVQEIVHNIHISRIFFSRSPEAFAGMVWDFFGPSTWNQYWKWNQIPQWISYLLFSIF